jgi:hypothetical protein
MLTAIGPNRPTLSMRRFDRRRLRITRPPEGDRLLILFRLPLLLVGGVTIYGVVGYRVVAGWSLLDALYVTAITLATVGFREVQPLDAKGQAFTISLILAGVVVLFVALGVVTELVVSGQLARVLRRRRTDRRIGRLDQYTVTCAYGRVGRAVAGGSCHRGASATPPQPWLVRWPARQAPPGPGTSPGGGAAGWNPCRHPLEPRRPGGGSRPTATLATRRQVGVLQPAVSS